jgi:hypothetical protein
MKNHRKVYVILIIAIYFIAFLFISRNISFPYLWYDEAGQFWISQGLNHDSEPLSAARGLADVIENNKHYNMDPGGFGVLLHFWSSISGSITWLRLLPFIFFLGVVASFVLLSYQWLKNTEIALLMGFIPLFIPVVLNTGFEVRAYSMELLGTMLCVIAAQNLKTRLTPGSILGWSIVFSLIITSRYSSLVVVFATSIYILKLILRHRSNLQEKGILLLVYTAPLLLSLAYIYSFAYVFQQAEHHNLPYMQFLKNDPSVLLKPHNLLYLLFTGLCLLLYFAKRKYPDLERYAPVLFVAVFVNIMVIILSLLGMHPWQISKSCISMVLLSLLCLSFIGGEVLQVIFELSKAPKFITLAFILAFAIYQKDDGLMPRDDMKNNPFFDLKSVRIDSFSRIYVTSWDAPSIRYSFEYGQLKKHKGREYPSQFTLQRGMLHRHFSNKDTMDAWSMQLPHMDELLHYDLIITSKLWNDTFEKWQLHDNTSTLWIKAN